MGVLRAEAEQKDVVIADLRKQVADLLVHRQEATTLRRQLSLLDERIRARDVAQEARVGEMVAKLRLHETVEGQLERARAALTRAQADYDRLIRVQQEDPGATSQSMVDLALAARDQAQAVGKWGIHEVTLRLRR